MGNDSPVLLIDIGKRYGGVELRVYDVALSLHRHGYAYAVAVCCDSELKRKLESAGLNVIVVPYGRGDPRILLFLRRIIRERNFRVIDAHNVQSQFWAWLVGRVTPRVRTIMTVHSPYRTEYPGLKGRVYEWVLKAAAWSGADFVAIASVMADYLVEAGVREDRIAVIPNALRPLKSPDPGQPELLDSLGWPANAFIVITVARLEPSKSLDRLIEAMRLAAPREPRLRSLIVGTGRLHDELEAQIVAAGLQDRVHLAGFVRDVAPLLRRSHAFCLSSTAEGLPYALLEASECGLPSVVTTVGEIPRLLEHGRTGYLAPPGDAAALAEGLVWMAQHPAEAAAIGAAARAHIRDRFSLERMIASVLARYGLSAGRTRSDLPLAKNA